MTLQHPSSDKDHPFLDTSDCLVVSGCVPVEAASVKLLQSTRGFASHSYTLVFDTRSGERLLLPCRKQWIIRQLGMDQLRRPR